MCIYHTFNLLCVFFVNNYLIFSCKETSFGLSYSVNLNCSSRGEWCEDIWDYCNMYTNGAQFIYGRCHKNNVRYLYQSFELHINLLRFNGRQFLIS
jgi:hypothetical protein